MTRTENHSPHSLGLGGDGDEIDAIEEVERRFGIRLDYSNARNWTTVGDVFAALQRALPAGQYTVPDAWATFAEAICVETDVDPTQVTPETLLIGQARFDWRLMVIVVAVIGFAAALMGYR